jgi:hypothetical protein
MNQQIYPSSNFPIWLVAVAVARQVRLLLMLAGALLAASCVWLARSGDAGSLTLAWDFTLLILVGLIGSFALHESAHVLLLKRVPGVTHIALERTMWRFSVRPMGSLSPGELARVAVAGPVSCVAVGAILLVVSPSMSLGWFYLAHGVFLLPFFGDGRNLVTALGLLQQAAGAGERDLPDLLPGAAQTPPIHKNI